MDEFRVGSTSYLDAHREAGHEEQKRKKHKHEEARRSDDRYISAAPELEPPDPAIEDYYLTSEEREESK